MRLLLDTHAFLWWMFADSRLSAKAAQCLGDESSALLLSSVSVVEMAIKMRLGNLRLETSLPDFVAEGMAKARITELPLRMDHAALLVDLPLHHRDPFDRMLIAQARTEGLPILTADPQFKNYDVELIW